MTSCLHWWLIRAGSRHLTNIFQKSPAPLLLERLAGTAKNAQHISTKNSTRFFLCRSYQPSAISYPIPS
ncbi:MAG: hypothetical protein AB1461_06605 [Thermodesulfobacteriota bacterium]